MILLQLLFLPFQAFLVFPPLAIIVGLAFRTLSRRRTGGRGAAGTAAVLWIGYGVYECYMRWIWSPSHIAPIRADLVLFAPLLYVISFFAIFPGSSGRLAIPPSALQDPQVTQKDGAVTQPNLEGVKEEPLTSSITCSDCNYSRQPTDDVPDWQCPNCQKAYNKTARGAHVRN